MNRTQVICKSTILPNHHSQREYRQHELKPVMDTWRWHVQEYLRHARQHNIYLIFYERLKEEPATELHRLLKYLEIDLAETQKQEILDQVSFGGMKDKNPRHVRKAELYGWMDELNEAENQTALSYCFPLLKLLSYPLGREVRLPGFLVVSPSRVANKIPGPIKIEPRIRNPYLITFTQSYTFLVMPGG